MTDNCCMLHRTREGRKMTQYQLFLSIFLETQDRDGSENSLRCKRRRRRRSRNKENRSSQTKKTVKYAAQSIWKEKESKKNGRLTSSSSCLHQFQCRRSNVAQWKKEQRKSRSGCNSSSRSCSGIGSDPHRDWPRHSSGIRRKKKETRGRLRRRETAVAVQSIKHSSSSSSR